ncbi:beta-1,4-glucuronyltransferase 1-like [Nilaparvata lugens]|uniref:beta-1,4-glucuronyltransferase 1-like n=1 Tax=Nilaparvata lugens TaxID=108931 RepID=UPI00193E5C26|nr:beta-1,4-glucuronyltransferase 1-like [Nilaparvata lugens]
MPDTAESHEPTSLQDSNNFLPTTAVNLTSDSQTEINEEPMDQTIGNQHGNILKNLFGKNWKKQLCESVEADDDTGGEVETIEENGKSENTKPVKVNKNIVEDASEREKVDVKLNGNSSRERDLKKVIHCHDKDARSLTEKRGNYWVLYNYVMAEGRRPHCWESITYTTHTEYTFLDNVEPVVERWRGPVSVAVYAPGTDFNQTLDSIRYLRQCGSELIRDFVSFHIYFPQEHMPKHRPIPHGDQILQAGQTDCRMPAPWVNRTRVLYRKQNNLLYMVNVGRNIARVAATTHYILSSDIELYPSLGMIDQFFDMLLRQEPVLKRNKPKVFVLPLFEVNKTMQVPNNKDELMKMMENGTAVTFHKYVCDDCHRIPGFGNWSNTPAKADNSLHVFHVAKRDGHWEPIYIGTNDEPFYEERISWEGTYDKFIQGYIMCVKEYEFLILDNAFLVHRPGIKEIVKDPVKDKLVKINNALVYSIRPEIAVLYGSHQDCYLITT